MLEFRRGMGAVKAKSACDFRVIGIGNWRDGAYWCRKRRSSRGERSARRPLERWREAPVRAATVGPFPEGLGRNPQRARRREVSSKLRRAPGGGGGGWGERGGAGGAAGLEEGEEDFSFGEGEDGVDGAEAFGPGAAEELHEDGFGLVVEGVGGEDAVGVAGGEEGGEKVVAGVAGSLFDRLGVAIG